MLRATTLPGAQRAAALALRARAHEALKDVAAAIADLEAATSLAPGDAGLWNELGVVCTIGNHHERALTALQKAVKTDPRNARAWNNLGNSLRTAGRLDEAAAAFEQAVGIKPDYALGVGQSRGPRRDLGDTDASAAALRRALAIDPKMAAALLALGTARSCPGSPRRCDCAVGPRCASGAE